MQPTPEPVRVFISSTFIDMEAERDQLVTVVFPELAERVESLGREFYDVDLRWGVPETGIDGERTNAWEYCKRWIDRVEPFFVCILGERYGWCPPAHEIPEDDRHAFEGMSITEMEVRHATSSRNKRMRSFFYLRGENVPTADPAAIAAYAQPEKRNELDALKTRIKTEYGTYCREYPCRWDGRHFVGLEVFGNMVLEDLWSGVLRDERYVSPEVWAAVLGHNPKDDPRYYDVSKPVPEDLARRIVAAAKPAPKTRWEVEREDMRAFANDRMRWFHGRTDQLETLQGFALRAETVPGRLCVVNAPAGQGKSALLAKLAQRLEVADCTVIQHYVGASQYSADIRGLLERLVWETEQAAQSVQAPSDVPRDVEGLRARFETLLDTTEFDRRLVIIIDGINQLSGPFDPSWVPRSISGNVRLVLSVVADPNGDDAALKGTNDWLESRNDSPRSIPLSALTESDIRAITTTFFEEYCKELDQEQLESIAQLKQAGNPLYLMVLLRQLKNLAGSELNRVVPQVLRDLEHRYPDAVSLFEWVLERAEVFGGDALRDWVRYMLIARTGMTPRELEWLLNRRHGPEGGRAALRIMRALRQYLQKRGPQFDFFHGQLKHAAKRKYQPGDTAPYHLDVACLFESRWRAPDRHAISELPHHLLAAGLITDQRADVPAAQARLCDLEFVDAKCRAGLTSSLIADFEATESAASQKNERLQDEWTQWYQFVRLETPRLEGRLMEWPGLIIQQAFNQATDGAVSKAARSIGNGQSGGAWIEWLNRPKYFAPTPCLRIHRREVSHAIAVSPDTIVSSHRNEIHYWNVESGRLLHPLSGHTKTVSELHRLDEHCVLSNSEDGTLRIWDLRSGICKHVLADRPHAPNGLKYAVWDDFVVTGLAGDYLDVDYAITKWNWRTGEKLDRLEGHDFGLVNLQVFDNKILLSISHDGTVRRWDLNHTAPPIVFQDASLVKPKYAVLNGGRVMSYGLRDRENVFRFWDLAQGPALVDECPIAGSVTQVRCLNDTDRVWIGSSRESILRDSATGESVGRFKPSPLSRSGGEPGAGLVGSSPSGRWAVAEIEREVYWLIDTKTGERHLELKTTGASKRFTFLSERFLAGTSRDYTIFVWECDSGQQMHRVDGHEAPIKGLLPLSGDRLLSHAEDGACRLWQFGPAALNPDAEPWREGSAPATVSPHAGVTINNTKADVWNLNDGAHRFELIGHTAPITTIVALDADTVATVSKDDTCIVWDIESGTRKGVLHHPDSIEAAGPTPNGNIYTVCNDGIVRIWSMADFQPIVHHHAPQKPITGFVRIDDHRLATGNDDAALRVWNLIDGTSDAMCDTDPGALTQFHLLPNGRLLTISATSETSDKSLLRVWDLDAKQCMHKWRGHNALINKVRIAADGRLFTADFVGEICIWDLTQPNPIQRINLERCLLIDFQPDDANRMWAYVHDMRSTLVYTRVWDLNTANLIDEMRGSEPFKKFMLNRDMNDNPAKARWNETVGGVVWTPSGLFPMEDVDEIVSDEQGHAIATAKHTRRVYILRLRMPSDAPTRTDATGDADAEPAPKLQMESLLPDGQWPTKKRTPAKLWGVWLLLTALGILLIACALFMVRVSLWFGLPSALIALVGCRFAWFVLTRIRRGSTPDQTGNMALAQRLAQQGNHAEAIRVLKRVVQSFADWDNNEGQVLALMEMSHLLESNGEAAEALDSLERAALALEKANKSAAHSKVLSTLEKKLLADTWFVLRKHKLDEGKLIAVLEKLMARAEAENDESSRTACAAELLRIRAKRGEMERAINLARNADEANQMLNLLGVPTEGQDAERLMIEGLNNDETCNQLLASTSPEKHAVILLQFAEELSNRAQFTRSREFYQRAAKCAAAAGQDTYELSAHVNAAMQTRNLGNLNAALAELDAYLPRINASKDFELRFIALDTIGRLLISIGENLDRARDVFETLEKLAIGKQQHHRVADVLGVQAELRKSSGDFAGALALRKKQFDSLQRDNDQPGIVQNLFTRAILHLEHLGQPPQALDLFQQAETVANAIPDPALAIDCLLNQIATLLRMDRIEEARSHTKRAENLIRRGGIPRQAEALRRYQQQMERAPETTPKPHPQEEMSDLRDLFS